MDVRRIEQLLQQPEKKKSNQDLEQAVAYIKEMFKPEYQALHAKHGFRMTGTLSKISKLLNYGSSDTVLDYIQKILERTGECLIGVKPSKKEKIFEKLEWGDLALDKPKFDIEKDFANIKSLHNRFYYALLCIIQAKKHPKICYERAKKFSVYFARELKIPEILGKPTENERRAILDPHVMNAAKHLIRFGTTRPKKAKEETKKQNYPKPLSSHATVTHQRNRFRISCL